MLSQPQARMLKDIRASTAWLGLIAPGGRVGAAVSGGPDSTAMLLLLAEHLPPGRLAVLHVNHRMRGSASDADERFVRRLAARLSLPFLSRRLPHLPRRGPPPSEATLREARYAALEAMARKLGARRIAVAHTADDQAETVLLRLARGTGLAGLSGMAAHRTLGRGLEIVRPLLQIRRKDLADYLRHHDQTFRTDRSNLRPDRARTRIRLKALPHLARVNPRAVKAILRLAARAGEAASFLAAQAGAAQQRIVRASGGPVRIDRRRLGRLHPALRPLVWQRAYARLRPGRTLDADHLEALALGRGQVALPGGVTADFRGASARLCSRTKRPRLL